MKEHTAPKKLRQAPSRKNQFNPSHIKSRNPPILETNGQATSLAARHLEIKRSADFLPCLNSNNTDKPYHNQSGQFADWVPETLNTRAGIHKFKEAQNFILSGDYDVESHGAKDLLNSLLSPYHRKAIFTLKANITKFIEETGLDNVGFLTLTFPDNVTDHKEAHKRFDNLRKRWFPQVFGPNSIRVSERQKRGAWHFHLLVDCRQDIRTGFDHDSVFPPSRSGRRPNYKSASSYLKNIWQSARETMPKYGFGRSELSPIKSTIEAMSKYVGKYLSKGNMTRPQTDKGVRLVGYRGNITKSSPKMSWNSDGSKEWRRKVEKFTGIVGLTGLEGLSTRYGAKWAYHLTPLINAIDHMPIDGVAAAAEQMARPNEKRWKAPFIDTELGKVAIADLQLKKGYSFDQGMICKDEIRISRSPVTGRLIDYTIKTPLF